MNIEGEKELFAAADAALPLGERALLGELVVFVAHRLQTATHVRERVGLLLSASAEAERLQMEVHTFLRECWDVLDGLGRQVNVCLYGLFPDAGLDPPERMTRQCTFYTVRRALHRAPSAATHPVSELLWEHTRVEPDPAYTRLSFLYNLSLFVPVPLPGGDSLPGTGDLPAHVQGVIRAAQAEGCGIEEGLDEILDWLRDFVAQCYSLMAYALERRAVQ
jgi:hypothetical protein